MALEFDMKPVEQYKRLLEHAVKLQIAVAEE